MKGRVAAGTVVAAVLSAGLLSAALGHAQATSYRAVTHTTVVHIKPFLAHGGLTPGYRVLATVRGYCWENAISTNRPDAFRCVHGNALFDPCFRNLSGKRVACPLGSPTTVEIIRLTRKLPHPSTFGCPCPAWQLKVARGPTCRYVSGATYFADGKRANFGCSDKTWLFGHANTRQEPWQIAHARGLHPHLKWVKIQTAWF